MTPVSHADPSGVSPDPPIVADAPLTTAKAPPTTGAPPGIKGSGPSRRLRVAAASVGAAVLGAAPHVLHHAGLLAGAAIFAGLGGKLIFAAIGLLAAIPLLLKLRRRSGSWRRPAAALALFGALFALTSFVLTPAILGAGSDDGQSTPSSAPAGHDPDMYKLHHP